jgi:hypothetical protein
MQPIISIGMWVSLPNEVRHRIRSIFHIPKSSNTHVDDGVILTDGVTNEDLKTLTISKMQIYLSDESSDFHKLFDKVVAKVNDELYPKKQILTESVLISSDEPLTIITEPKKRGRPSKKNA